MPPAKKNTERDYRNLLSLLEENFVARDEKRTNMVVGGLVQHIVAQWRMQFCNAVVAKFNCYFMLPFVDEFHKFVRMELLDKEDLSEVFDLAAARRSLEKTRDELANECLLNKELQEKFRKCSNIMNSL